MPNDKIAFNFPDLNVPKNLTDSVLASSDANLTTTSEERKGLLPDMVINVYYGRSSGHYFADVSLGAYSRIPILAGNLQGFLKELAVYFNNEDPSKS